MGSDFIVPLIPMGKLIQPEDIAETILFLASENLHFLFWVFLNKKN